MNRYFQVKSFRRGTTNYDASCRELTTSNFGSHCSIKRVKLQLGITGMIYADNITSGKELRREIRNVKGLTTVGRSLPRHHFLLAIGNVRGFACVSFVLRFLGTTVPREIGIDPSFLQHASGFQRRNSICEQRRKEPTYIVPSPISNFRDSHVSLRFSSYFPGILNLFVPGSSLFHDTRRK